MGQTTSTENRQCVTDIISNRRWTRCFAVAFCGILCFLFLPGFSADASEWIIHLLIRSEALLFPDCTP
ncbi:hypothetical protein GALMADRAFT_217982 [Galerina marginata CBS 339.88]|uniref:Uncharacterized protein n=1 Tax=Galerina marginata (strain CBS 339.88) TaxID=685588 RepID=A0A067TRG4_GALM3|nr:hypothetical protein GALMADRAFT_217982 [Galerina marginata CBS 339.88]